MDIKVRISLHSCISCSLHRPLLILNPQNSLPNDALKISKDGKDYDGEVMDDVNGNVNLKNMKQINDAEEDDDKEQTPAKRK